MGDNLKFFKEGLDYAKKVIPELKTAILKDKYQTELSQVGGLIGLVGIGYEIYARWRTSKQTYAERAIDPLIKCVFAASHETLKEIRKEFLVSHNNENQENEIEIDFDKKQFLIDLLASFEKEDGPDDISSLLDLPSIESFKLIVVSQLKGKFKDKDEIIINYFNKNLRPTLEFIARQDKELTNYMDIQTRVLKGLRITRIYF